MALAVPILLALCWLPGPPGAAAPPGEPDLSLAARRLQAYVQIDTSNPPGNEKAGALYLKHLLDEAGIASEIHEPRPGRAALYARLKGSGARSGLLLLLHHHIDVLPAAPAG